jgi:hypothetical protein
LIDAANEKMVRMDLRPIHDAAAVTVVKRLHDSTANPSWPSWQFVALAARTPQGALEPMFELPSD